jgi:hypothetical protein
MVDNNGRIRWYTNTCPPVPVGGCNSVLVPTTTPAPQIVTGIAIDEGLGLIFIAYPNLLTGVSRIAVNDLNNPCVQFDMIGVPQCQTNFGPIRGLTCDWANNMLHATDGITTMSINYAWNGTNVSISGFDCCPGGIVVLDTMVGLTVRPGRATSLGTACNNGACATCPMAHRLGNDPVLGNAQFRLGLDQAQPNVFAFCLVGAGPCTNVGVVTPPLCGPIHTGPLLGSLGANITGGGFAICDGTTTFPLPLPINPGLAGAVFGSQCLTVCFNAAGGFGTGLSNCLSWQLQGN